MFGLDCHARLLVSLFLALGHLLRDVFHLRRLTIWLGLYFLITYLSAADCGTIFKMFLTLLLALAIIASVASADDSIPLWPIPSSVSIGVGNSVTLNSDFQFALGANFNNDLAMAAIDRYSALIGKSSSTSGSLHSCQLNVDSTTIPEIIGADETYTVSVSTEGSCEIQATNLWGLLRGLETFSQLLVRDTDANTVLLRNTPVSVKDTPRYGHRGVLIDTSRHYLSVDQIKRVIDSLPTNKYVQSPDCLGSMCTI